LYRDLDGVAANPPPLLERLPEERAGKLEDLQEYVDTHHPLWTRARLRSLLLADKAGTAAPGSMTRRERVAFIRREWGGQSVNPLANLSSLPTMTENQTRKTEDRVGDTINYDPNDRERVFEYEKHRLARFKAIEHRNLEAERKQRKRKLDEPRISAEATDSSVSMKEFQSEYLELCCNNEIGEGTAAEGLRKIENLFCLKSAYSKENTQLVKISNQDRENFLFTDFFFRTVIQSYGDPFNMTEQTSEFVDYDNLSKSDDEEEGVEY